MKNIKVKQLKPIQRTKDSFVFPISTNTRLIIDKSKSKEKEHQLIYQQEAIYGSIGDCCNYLSDKDLLDLQKKGMIEITYD